jgi:hypothetical protein
MIMDTLRKLTLTHFGICSGYFFLISLAALFLFMPGLTRVGTNGSAISTVLLIFFAVAVCFVLTVFFMKITPERGRQPEI